MSNDAHAGERRTTSPARAAARAAASASVSERAARDGEPLGGERLGQPWGVLADQDGQGDAAARGPGQGREILPLALAPGDQHDGLGEALERLDGRFDVGALRVVVVGHPVQLADELDPMGHRAKGGDALADHRRRHAQPARAGRRGQRVLDVVGAPQRDLAERADGLRRAVEAGHDPAIAHEHAARQFAPPAEPDEIDADGGRQGARARVVVVEHGGVARALVLEDPRLGGRVGGERPMAIEMVRGHVQDRGHPGPEGLDRLRAESSTPPAPASHRRGRARPRRRAVSRCCPRPARAAHGGRAEFP